jgi:hypothetical protein
MYSRYLNAAVLKTQFEQQVSTLLGLPVVVSRIRLNFPTVELQGIRIGNSVDRSLPFAELGEVTATPDYWDLAAGNVRFENLSVASVTLQLVKNPSGKWLIPEGIFQTFQAGDKKNAQFPLQSFSGSNLDIQWEDQGLKRTFILHCSKADLSKQLMSNQIDLSMNGHLEGLGDLSVTGLFSWNEQAEVKVTVKNINSTNLQSFLPLNLKIPVGTTESVLNASAHYWWSGKLDVPEFQVTLGPDISIKGNFRADSLTPLVGSGSVSLAPMPTADLFALASGFFPDKLNELSLHGGKTGAQCHVSYAGGTLENITVLATLQGISVTGWPLATPGEHLSGQFAFNNQRVTWNAVTMEIAGAKFSSSKGEMLIGEGFPGQGDFTLQGQIAPILTALAAYLPSQVKKMHMKGALDFSGNLEVKGSQPTINGRATLTKLSFIAPQGNIPIEIQAVKAKLTNLGKQTGRVAFEELMVQLMGIEVKAKGTLENTTDLGIDLEAQADIDLAKLHRALPNENASFKKRTTISGKASVVAKLTGSTKKPLGTANVILADAGFSFPEKKLQIQHISGKITATTDSAAFNDMRAVLADGKLSLTGTIKHFSDPVIVASGTLQQANVAALQALIEHNSPAFPKGLAVSGNADIDISIKGKASQPQVSGSAVLHENRVFHPVMIRPLSRVTGLLRFDNQSLKSDGLQFDWGSSRVRLSGKIEDFARLKLGFDFSVQPLDITDIGTFFLKGTGYQAQGAGTASGKISGPLEGMIITGTATVPAGRIEAPVSKVNTDIFAFPFTHGVIPFAASDGTLSIKNARASLFGGTLTGSGKVFTREKPIRFQFDTQGTSLQTQSFLSLNTSQKSVLAGPIALTCQAVGDTSGLNSLNGNWSLNMKNGHYQAPPVISPVLSMLNLNQFASGNLTSMQGNFQIKNGRMNSDNLLFQSSIGNASFKGSVGFDTALSGKLNLSFSPAAVQQSQVLQQFSDDGKTVNVPTKVEGTLLSPSFPGFSTGHLIELGLKRKGQQLLQEALMGKMGGQTTSPASGTNQPKLNPEQLISDALKGVFRQKNPQASPQPQTQVQQSPHQSGSPSGHSGTGIATAPVAPSPSPRKQIENELEKALEKGLKNLFK